MTAFGSQISNYRRVCLLSQRLRWVELELWAGVLEGIHGLGRVISFHLCLSLGGAHTHTSCIDLNTPIRHTVHHLFTGCVDVCRAGGLEGQSERGRERKEEEQCEQLSSQLSSREGGRHNAAASHRELSTPKDNMEEIMFGNPLPASLCL